MIDAMIFDEGTPLLRAARIAAPVPGPHQLLLKVEACGVCRTDLHVVDGELAHPKKCLVPGHEIVGRVLKVNQAGPTFQVGDRVGVPWLGHTCGRCRFCLTGAENLCDHAQFTGYTLDGGYAELAVADSRYCFPIPAGYTSLEAAPLLCAGLIGYRALNMVGDARRIGIYGFGAAAHIVSQVANHEGRVVYAFTRPGDRAAQQFARHLGVRWAGDSTDAPPQELDAALLFAPVGSLVPAALKAVVKGGIVVCAGIHMSDIPAFPYDLLWGERRISSVANLTRADGRAFMRVAADFPIHTHVTGYPLEAANTALADLRAGRLTGAAVLDLGRA